MTRADAIALPIKCDCGRPLTAPARRSAPVERLRKLEHTLGRRVPTFRRMRVVVQVAAHAHEPRALREGEVPAHGRACYVGVEFRQLRAVDEINAPFALHMRTAVEHVVGMRMGVATDPEVDRPWVCREIILERLCPSCFSSFSVLSPAKSIEKRTSDVATIELMASAKIFLLSTSILLSFPTFHLELMPVGTFEDDSFYSLIKYPSRLSTPRTNFSYYPVFKRWPTIGLQRNL